jgi:hypothetical protein
MIPSRLAGPDPAVSKEDQMTHSGLWRYLTRSLSACLLQTKTKTIFLTMLALAALPLSKAAEAQCYTFVAGTTASLTLNITNLPTPSTASEGHGGTNYTYALSGLSGNKATLISGSTNDSITAPPAFTITVDANSGYTVVQIGIISTSPEFTANVELENTGSDQLPSGWPSALPALSNWSKFRDNSRTSSLVQTGRCGTAAREADGAFVPLRIHTSQTTCEHSVCGFVQMSCTFP